MDGLLDFFNSIWNFLNSFWIPLTIVVVGIVYFAVMYYKANRVVDKHRKDVQQKIVNDVYADYIHKKYSKDE